MAGPNPLWSVVAFAPWIGGGIRVLWEARPGRWVIDDRADDQDRED